MKFLAIGLVLITQLIMQILMEGVITHDIEGSSEEYCHSEVFQPRCMKNEVIIMKSATYGRMRIGRCITAKEVEELGSKYLGCSAAVMAQLDRKCSGKSECDVRVAEISVENIEQCISGLRFHLEASYTCISIADEKRSCVVDVSTTPIHIVGSGTCGTKSQPWIIETPIGQKISVSLIAFSDSDSDNTDGKSHQSCHSYGLVEDKARKTNFTICVTDVEREKNLYLTAGNVVSIFLNSSTDRTMAQGRIFIIKLQAVGCSDLIPPEDAYLKRNDDTIVVGCYSSRKTWHLYCKDGTWIGVIGNCSQGFDILEAVPVTEHKSSRLSNEQILVVMVLGAITLTFCFAIICIGAVCLRRYYSLGKLKREYKTINYQVNSTTGQPSDPGIHQSFETGVRPTGSDSHGIISAPQMPTYSVFIGDGELNDGTSRPTPA